MRAYRRGRRMKVAASVVAVAAVIGLAWGWIGAGRRLKRRERAAQRDGPGGTDVDS
jgi:hypothetical protein